jgi:hypothetical protein
MDPPDATKGKGKEAAQKERKKSKPTEAHMNPMELARNLEALLPRRPKPKADIRKAGRGRSTMVSNEEVDKKQKGGKRKAQGTGKGKGRQKAEGSDGEEEEEEKRLRQVRIDYFKKLDGYEVQKEDVYIV